MDYFLTRIITWADKYPKIAITILLSTALFGAVASVDIALGLGLIRSIKVIISNL